MATANGLISEVGNRYGRLLVLRKHDTSKDRKAMWVCRCDCGNEAAVKGQNLRRGNTGSCGCLQVEESRANHTTHGMTAGRKVHQAYASYHAARARCTQLGHIAAANYSGRGIKFLLPPFDEFWVAMRETWKPGLTLDRKDNDGHYQIGNVRWATRREQAKNTRRQRVYTSEGKEVTIEDLAKVAGVPVKTMRQRIYRAGVDVAVGMPRRYRGQALFVQEDSDKEN